MAGTISLLEARRIAGEWHGGQSSFLYSFSSWSKPHSKEQLTGALFEVRRELSQAVNSDETDDLIQLKDFLTAMVEEDDTEEEV